MFSALNPQRLLLCHTPQEGAVPGRLPCRCRCRDLCWGGQLSEPRATLLIPVLGAMALQGPVPCWGRGEDADAQVSPHQEAQVTGTWALDLFNTGSQPRLRGAQPDKKALGTTTHLHGLHARPEGLAAGPS